MSPYTPYVKMAENAFFCLHVNWPSLPPSIASVEFKSIFGLKQDNEGRLTYRQENHVFSTILKQGIAWLPQVTWPLTTSLWLQN